MYAARRLLLALLIVLSNITLLMLLWPWLVIHRLEQQIQIPIFTMWDNKSIIVSLEHEINYDNIQYIIKAQKAILESENSQHFIFVAPEIIVTQEDGSWFSLKSLSGVYDRNINAIRFTEKLVYNDIHGSILNTDSAEIFLTKKYIISETPISGYLLDNASSRMIKIKAKGFYLDHLNYWNFLGETVLHIMHD